MLLNLILKPLFKNSENKIDDIELPSDIEISLSMIESGCLFVPLNQIATLIIIGSREELLLLNNINKITFKFELIEKEEFPSIAMHVDINTVSNNPFSFDYFFNTESPLELEILKKLTIQDHFDMLLYESQVLSSKKIELSKNDKLELKSLVDKASQSFDKIG